MRQIQFNYLNMVEGVIAGMRKEQPLWENEPEIVTIFNAIVADSSLISAKGESISGTDTTGYTSAKDNTFDRLMAATYKLVCKLSAYAKTRNDAKLLPLVNISFTSLSRGPEKEVIMRCSSIADQAEKRMSELTTFRVTTDQIASIKQLIKDYDQYTGDRSTASSGKSVDGKDITSLISGLREKLEILDDMVEGLIEDDGFIARYKSLRMIIDYGKGKTLKNKETEKATV